MLVKIKSAHKKYHSTEHTLCVVLLLVKERMFILAFKLNFAVCRNAKKCFGMVKTVKRIFQEYAERMLNICVNVLNISHTGITDLVHVQDNLTVQRYHDASTSMPRIMIVPTPHSTADYSIHTG